MWDEIIFITIKFVFIINETKNFLCSNKIRFTTKFDTLKQIFFPPYIQTSNWQLECSGCGEVNILFVLSKKKIL